MTLFQQATGKMNTVENTNRQHTDAKLWIPIQSQRLENSCASG
jgi:hypothetical protein